MKQLLNEWKKFLITEGTVKPENLPNDVYVFVNTDDSPHEISFSFVDRNGSPITDGFVGSVRIALVSEQTDNYYGGSCSDGYVVTHSTVKDDNGALLYDVAIEWASTRGTGHGLAPEREHVSDPAKSIWYNIFKHRHDIEMIQLDSPDNALTPEDDDNCAQNAAKSIAANDLGDSKKWYDTPISKMYKKKNAVFLDKLESMGRLIQRDGTI